MRQTILASDERARKFSSFAFAAARELLIALHARQLKRRNVARRVEFAACRNPSINGCAIFAEIGVIQCTQYAESLGVSTGTGINQRFKSRAPA
jgi:hypothetical protein